MDQIHKAEIAKLLRFETSTKEKGELISLDEYVERMCEGQDKIYFLHTPSRETALSSPYYEQFRKKGIEVLFLHGNIDEYVMGHVEQYKTFRLWGAENPDVDLDKIKSSESADEDASPEDALVKELNATQCQRLSDYLVKTLTGKLFEAKVSKRLSDSPAVISTGHEQASLHRMMKQMAMMQGKNTNDAGLPPQVLEYNPKHNIMKKLYWLSRANDEKSISKARQMSEQVLDNALIAAGLLDDPRLMLGRLNKLLESALDDVVEGEEEEVEPEAPKEEEKK